MKFTKTLLVSVMALAALPAMAQRSFDEFSAPRAVLLSVPNNFSYASPNFTNTGVDIRGLCGVAKIDVLGTTNTGAAGVLSMLLQTSPDTTNWFTVSNGLAMITNYTSLLVTNSGGTNMIGTNKILLPGTTTTPSSAAASGIAAQPYLVPLAYTAGGSITLSATSPNEFGLEIDGVGITNRYVRTVFISTGAGTNWTLGGAILTAPSCVNAPGY